jgi:DNA-binding transcriptional MerR regulator
MGVRSYTIGELARLSGQSVRRIRFYSDKGLLPSLRTESNYRVYTDTDLAKLDLFLALREAGVSLDAIGKLLRHRLPLKEVLLTRLDTLEAEIATKRRAAIILRVTVLHGSAGARSSAILLHCHERRTYSGRPSSSIRFSALTAIVTSVVRRRSVHDRRPSPMIRLKRLMSASTSARQL